jgi:hypothetical protein
MKVIAGLPADGVAYTRFDLIEFERRVATAPGVYTSTFYRYCNAPSNLTYAGAAASDMPSVGAVFTSRSFNRNAIVKSASLSGVTSVDFDDHDDLLKALTLNYDFLDWRFRLWTAGVVGGGDFSLAWITIEIAGRCENAEWDVEDGNRFQLEVGHDTLPANVFGPREKYSPGCRFRFKEARCGYVGGVTTCDRTLTNCTTLGNQMRFGGFRKIPLPDDKPPVWGGSSSANNWAKRANLYPPGGE